MLAVVEKVDDILPETVVVKGHANESRVYAEDPKSFYPSPGRLTVFRPPLDKSIRIETGYAEGREVTPHYDPMIAKVIVHAASRDAAIERLAHALETFDIRGVKTNIPAALAVLPPDPFRCGRVHTGIIADVLTQKKTA